MLKTFHTFSEYEAALKIDRTALIGCICKIATRPNSITIVGEKTTQVLDCKEWAKFIDNVLEENDTLSGITSDIIDINAKIIRDSLKFTATRFALFASKANTVEETEAVVDKAVEDMIIFVKNFHQVGNTRPHFKPEDLS